MLLFVMQHMYFHRCEISAFLQVPANYSDSSFLQKPSEYVQSQVTGESKFSITLWSVQFYFLS